VEGMEKKRVLVVIMAMISAFSVMPMIVSAQGYPGAGCPSETKFNGTLHGGVYFEQKGWSQYGQMTRTFNVPQGNIKVARIYTGIWGGSPGKGGFFNITIQNTGGITKFPPPGAPRNMYKACDPCNRSTNCAPFRQCRCDALNASPGVGSCPSDICVNNLGWNLGLNRANVHDCIVGCGVHFISVNATPYITPGTNTITVMTKPCSGCCRGGWDGRIYLIALLVVYENSSMPELTYWINEGALYLEKGSDCDGSQNHLNASKYFNGTYGNCSVVKLWSLGWPHVINATVPPAYTKLNNCTLPVPDETQAYAGGYYDVMVKWNNISCTCLNPTSNFLEYRDPNPYYERAFVEVLIAQTQERPDLEIEGIEFPKMMRPNRSYVITVNVKNSGNKPAGAFNVSLEAVGSEKKPIAVLNPGESVPVNFTVNLPEGCYKFIATADCDGDVNEDDEKNNQKEDWHQVGYYIVVESNSDFNKLVNDGLAKKVGDTYYIQNLSITNCAGDGISIKNTNVPFVIRNCTVHDCGWAPEKPGHGIYIENVTNGSAEIKIEENEVCNISTLKCIRIVNSSHIIVESNYVHNCSKYGIDIYPERMPYPDCEYITVSNNTIVRCLYGIELLGFNCTIRDNIILNTTSWGGGEEGWGIYVAGNYSKIYNNTIAYSDSYGMYVDNDRPCLPTFWNCIFGNTFIDNNQRIPHSSQAYDSGINYWNSTLKLGYYNNTCGAACAHDNYIGNYWSDLACTDANNDGICDSSYDICGGTMKDYAPLVQPWANYSRIMCGDVDCSGAVDVYDVYPVFRRVFGDPVCSDWAADVDCSGAVDVYDVYPVFRRVFGDPVDCCTGCK